MKGVTCYPLPTLGMYPLWGGSREPLPLCLPFVRAAFILLGMVYWCLCVSGKGVLCSVLWRGICWCVLGCGRKVCGFIPVEETVLFSRGGESGADSREGTFPSLFLRGWGLCICHFEEFARLSPGRGRCLRICISVCLSSGAERAGETIELFPPTAALRSVLGSAPTGLPGSASGAEALLPPGAGPSSVETSAPGGGCALCGSPGCVAGLRCSGSRGC